MDTSINILSLVNHLYNTKASAFNLKSIDSILLKGSVLLRKIYTMRNSLRDSDGYQDTEAYQIDEIPKTMQLTGTVAHEAQVITAARVLENCKEEEPETQSESVTQQNSTYQSDSKGNYKYAFGSRVKMEEEFDKGLGIVGTNKLNPVPNQRKSTGFSSDASESSKPKATAKKTAPASKPSSSKAAKPPKTKPMSREEKLEELKKAPTPEVKEYTPIEVELINQKAKLEKEFNLVAKEERKLEMLKKKRNELFSNPFKNIKEPSADDIKKSRKRKSKNEFDGRFFADASQEMFEDDEKEEAKMHSIQEAKEEEDDEYEQIGKGMRTGLSIEGKEDCPL